MYKNLRKLPEPQGPALARGTWVHEQCEHYVAGRIKKLGGLYEDECFEWHPKTVAELKRLRKVYPKGNIRTELDLAFTKDWKPCEWMAKDVWARMKVDLVEHGKEGVEITDWKTGRFKPQGEYDDQLMLYCIALLTATKGAQVATARLFFTDVGEEVRRSTGILNVYDLITERKKFERRVERMFKDTEHAPTPNPGCRYCAWSVQKQKGFCKF
jgi:hypothetical protein